MSKGTGHNTGWIKKKLGDVCFIERGGSPRPIDKFLTDAPDGINWIKIGDTKNVTKYITTTEEKIRPEGAKRSRMVFEGDFILSNSMSFGRPYIMKTSGCIHDGWLVLREREPKINQDYLYYVLGSDLVFRQFDRLAAGSTVRNLNIGLVQRVEIPIPPPPEQQRIVSILDKAFEAIATAKANADKNLQNACALSESQLQAAFAESADESEQKPLRNFCDLISGQHIDAADYNTESRGVAYLTGPSDFGPLHPTVTKWTEHPKRMAQMRDILITVKGSGVGKVNLLQLKEVAISRQLMAIRVGAVDVCISTSSCQQNLGIFNRARVALPFREFHATMYSICSVRCLRSRNVKLSSKRFRSSEKKPAASNPSTARSSPPSTR